ncbi:MAG: tRNA (adenosine(37)-N6)-threonylcarbamoyltransferase complex ATPase subunit type 1 TsaE [Bacteroidia bacterium]
MKYGISEIGKAVETLIPLTENHLIFCFYGEMGAGKTTLIKELCKSLNVLDEVSSPSFGLVNEYKISEKESIFHFDFYRIKNIEEVYDIGYEDYFDSGNICLIEWPEKIESILSKENFLKIEIEILNDIRNLSVKEIINY